MASSTIAALPSNGSKEAVAEPPSYIASFNPFPALVIGVTGAAMSAHAQTYVFQVRHLVFCLHPLSPIYSCRPFFAIIKG